MESNVIVKNHGIIIKYMGHAIIVGDVQGEPDHMAAVILDKCIFEELQAMCRMAVHMVADMPGDRAYTIAVFIANTLGGYAREVTPLFGGDVYTSFTETR